MAHRIVWSRRAAQDLDSIQISCYTNPTRTLPWNPTLAQKTRKNGAPIVRDSAGVYCLILGFTAEYNKSVRKFTAT